MSYIKVNQDTSTEYPYNLGKLAKDFPDVSFPVPYVDSTLAPYGVFPVQPTVPPTATSGKQKVEELPPALISGVWTQQWLLTGTSPAEETAAIRVIKDDWRASLRTLTDEAAYQRGYGDQLGLLSLEPNGAFKADRDRYIAWVEDCLIYLNTTFNAYAGGTPLPSKDAFFAGLPALVW